MLTGVKYSMESEKIKFEFIFISEYWNNPPYIDISIDGSISYSGFIEKKISKVVFYKSLDFRKHKLCISRKGKTDNETKILEDGTFKTQTLTLKTIKIDNINIRNLAWHYSMFYPEYSQSYRDENPNLTDAIQGELVFGHNGLWEYQFSSPHYYDVVNKVRGYAQ